MATKIRLQRGGKKNKPVYRIVVTDSRQKRDGRFIEKLGSYNPNIADNQIILNFDAALSWYMKGAEPTETARMILSKEGILYKKHLLVGVTKGALTQEQADKKFAAWVEEKDKKNSNVASAKAKAAADKAKAEAELRAKVKKEVEEAAKKAAAAAVLAAEEAQAPAVEEVAAEEVVAEAAAEVTEVAAEATEVVAEATETEAPAAEASAESAE
jgi:small subunit ribosomal protein S16